MSTDRHPDEVRLAEIHKGGQFRIIGTGTGNVYTKCQIKDRRDGVSVFFVFNCHESQVMEMLGDTRVLIDWKSQ